MTTQEVKLAQSVLNESSTASSLAPALRACEKSQGLGVYATAPAVKELLLQVPDISDRKLELVREICDGNPQAAEDMALLEQDFRDEQSIDSEYAAEVHYTSAFINQPSR